MGKGVGVNVGVGVAVGVLAGLGVEVGVGSDSRQATRRINKLTTRNAFCIRNPLATKDWLLVTVS